MICHAPTTRPLLGPSEINTILRSNYPTLRKSKQAESSRLPVRSTPDIESPTPHAPSDSCLATSNGSYVLPKPTRGAKHTRSDAVSGDLTTPASSLGSNVFTNPDSKESNPLYVPDMRLARVRLLADDVLHHRGANKDLLGAITLTFNPEHRDRVFPVRIEEVPPIRNATQPCRYRLQEEYAAHLIAVMELVSNTLNEFLRAAESPRLFSFRSSAYYSNRSFKELVNSDWPTQTIIASLER